MGPRISCLRLRFGGVSLSSIPSFLKWSSSRISKQKKKTSKINEQCGCSQRIENPVFRRRVFFAGSVWFFMATFIMARTVLLMMFQWTSTCAFNFAKENADTGCQWHCISFCHLCHFLASLVIHLPLLMGPDLYLKHWTFFADLSKSAHSLFECCLDYVFKSFGSCKVVAIWWWIDGAIISNQHCADKWRYSVTKFLEALTPQYGVFLWAQNSLRSYGLDVIICYIG